MPQVDVSVIIAAYNAAGTVTKAIASALDQRAVTLEVIVADDASTDGTAATVQTMNDPRVTCVTLPFNGGPGVARNAAIALARGNFVAVLDADDVFLPSRLHRLLTRAQSAGADIIVDAVEVVGPEGETRPMLPASTLEALGPRLELPAFIAGNHPMVTHFTLGQAKPIIARQFLIDHALRYVPDLRVGEDYMLLADCLAHGAVCAVEPVIGYAYSRGHASISHRLTEAHITAMLRADEAFRQRHHLSPKANAALDARRAALLDAGAFTQAITALKARSPIRAISAVIRRPRAAAHFRYPLVARLKRLRRWRPRSSNGALSVINRDRKSIKREEKQECSNGVGLQKVDLNS